MTVLGKLWVTTQSWQCFVIVSFDRSWHFCMINQISEEFHFQQSAWCRPQITFYYGDYSAFTGSIWSYHCIVMTFSGVITNDRNDVHAKDPCQRSKVKVTYVKPQFNRFRTVTTVWIHIWQRYDTQILVRLRRGALLFLMDISQISRSKCTIKSSIFLPQLGIFQLKLQFELTDGYEMMDTSWSCIVKAPHNFSMLSVKFQGQMGLDDKSQERTEHTRGRAAYLMVVCCFLVVLDFVVYLLKIANFDPNWAFCGL